MSVVTELMVAFPWFEEQSVIDKMNEYTYDGKKNGSGRN